MEIRIKNLVGAENEITGQNPCNECNLCICYWRAKSLTGTFQTANVKNEMW